MASVKSDPLFLKAEQLAGDVSLFPRAAGQRARLDLEGVLEAAKIRQKVRQLQALDVDEYIDQTVLPVEDPKRPGARAVLRRLSWPVVREVQVGPLYMVEMRVPIGGRERRVGFVAQERTVRNGFWMPEHHLKAVEIVRALSTELVPIVTIIDTPGADAGDEANRGNQAHSISRLIAEMAQIHVPTVAIILGNGYSGGAIPLATTNLLLSVRDGVFNTIQPRGLANIARKYDLSWQECAKFVGVSPYELYRQGYLDGIVDFVPGEDEQLHNLELAIVSSLAAIENDAMSFVKLHAEDVFEHYRGSIFRFLEPSETLKDLQALGTLSLLEQPTAHLNVFAVAFRYLRYLGLRRRIRSTTVERYGRLSVDEIPRGERSERMERERRNAFEKWLESPIEVKYDDLLTRAWKRYAEARRTLDQDRGRVASFFLGSRQANYEKAKEQLVLEVGCYLYNLWKDAAQYNFHSLIDYLNGLEGRALRVPEGAEVTVLDIVSDDDVRPDLVLELESFTAFDLLYDNVIDDLKLVAREASDHNFISRESVERLLGTAMRSATRELVSRNGGEESSRQDELRLRRQFLLWLRRLASFKRRGAFLKSVAQWKKLAFPRVSEPLFAIVTFIFERLLPSYYESEEGGRVFDGRINLRDIGVKDFWNRLDRAYRDLLIGDILARVKRETRVTPQAIFERFFSDVRELDGSLMTADPVGFPGFRVSIEEALRRGIKPCGTITALATLKGEPRRQVGVMVSNLEFQAGSFDMASAEKFCRLLVECARRHLPVLCFVSSGGMQTKEGAGSLFSMAIVNDRITRFVRDHDLPVVCFGFGDCTGGAQASLVTHPLALTYYFSGTNMPFAGQIVVPSHLPLTSTLSNYLSTVPGSMEGLVRHPFAEGIDDEMREVDARLPVAEESVEDVLARVLAGRLRREPEEVSAEMPAPATFRPVRRTLIHARGCTAVKLLRTTRKLGIEAVLVQSDPDMESVAASMLGERDTLVCLGGSTPDESYLNAYSVVRIAEREGADSLHPGIGFLSESAAFADLCRRHDLNFIGPSVSSMELMGNKSNAIQTALKLEIPVVPGSHGIVTEPEAARVVAESIGFPVIIKAVHGGGGKGIRIVRRAEDFAAAFQHITVEARSAFGNGDCYIEKAIVSLRHVEVQLLRDRFGHTRIIGLRDCSVQRANQKLIEESGSTALPEPLREAAFRYAEAIAGEIDYVGAGTVEFIHDLGAEAVYFMEMNTRLQVEHPVTELTTGVDIVKTQFDIAGGDSLEDLIVDQRGYAIEARINAEKAVRDSSGGVTFVPDPGTVTRCHFPARDDVHVISTIAEGSVVPPYYDSMVAQIICWGRDRAAAIDHMTAYLRDVRIEGIATNIPLYLRILADDVFRNGEYDTGYLPAFLARTDVRGLVQEIEQAAARDRGRVDRAMIAIEGSDELKVIAPSTGIFYLTPSPNEPELTRVGDLVSSEQTLCLLEAMKLFQPVSLSSFNEDGELYPSDYSYEIVRVNPSNAQPVNQGDLLFVVRPAKKVA